MKRLFKQFPEASPEIDGVSCGSHTLATRALFKKMKINWCVQSVTIHQKNLYYKMNLTLEAKKNSSCILETITRFFKPRLNETNQKNFSISVQELNKSQALATNKSEQMLNFPMLQIVRRAKVPPKK